MDIDTEFDRFLDDMKEINFYYVQEQRNVKNNLAITQIEIEHMKKEGTDANWKGDLERLIIRDHEGNMINIIKEIEFSKADTYELIYYRHNRNMQTLLVEMHESFQNFLYGVSAILLNNGVSNSFNKFLRDKKINRDYLLDLTPEETLEIIKSVKNGQLYKQPIETLENKNYHCELNQVIPTYRLTAFLLKALRNSFSHDLGRTPHCKLSEDVINFENCIDTRFRINGNSLREFVRDKVKYRDGIIWVINKDTAMRPNGNFECEFFEETLSHLCTYALALMRRTKVAISPNSLEAN